MEIELGLVIALVVIVGLFLAGRLFPKARPKEPHFKCARCGNRALHSERTIEAWRNKKTKFFCQICHRKWLERQPLQTLQTRQQHSSAGRSAASGCLGMVFLLLAIPAVLTYALLHIYA